MLKRLIILLTFLGYSLTLAHSLVPHHHHDQVAQNHSHHHHATGHHDDDDHKSLSHFFADAIHHPSAEQIILSSQSENVQKSKTIGAYFILALDQILFPELKPPDNNISYPAAHYSFNLSTISLLRAPPAI